MRVQITQEKHIPIRDTKENEYNNA